MHVSPQPFCILTQLNDPYLKIAGTEKGKCKELHVLIVEGKEVHALMRCHPPGLF